MTHDKPNILLIMSDQLIPFLTGPYGHPIVKTPNLNQLAAQGIVFDSAYSPCPVCAPARAALLTGKYISRIGAFDNAATFSSEEPTIPYYLTSVGYDTVLSGKMHFIGPDQLHGYSRRLTTDIYPADYSWVPIRGRNTPSERLHAQNYIGEAIQVGRWNQYLAADEETHFRAIQYLRAKSTRKVADETSLHQTNPFFLTVSYHHPHEPFMPPKYFWELYKDAEIELPDYPINLQSKFSTLDRWLNTYHGVDQVKTLQNPESIRKVRRAYYALISMIDQMVGELLTVLEETGFSQNTIVIFTSDHGDMLCERGMVQKRTFYEWSSRVPLIIRFPDSFSAGKKVSIPVNLIDLFPTILDMAAVPEENRLPVDGHSLFDHLSDQKSTLEFTFSEYHSQGSHAPCFMVRCGVYKFIYIHGHESQLFNLQEDPKEWHNLSGNPAYLNEESRLLELIFSHFDPDAIERSVSNSVERRWLLKKAMDITGTRWDYEPKFDPKKPVSDQYLLN